MISNSYEIRLFFYFKGIKQKNNFSYFCNRLWYRNNLHCIDKRESGQIPEQYPLL